MMTRRKRSPMAAPRVRVGRARECDKWGVRCCRCARPAHSSSCSRLPSDSICLPSFANPDHADYVRPAPYRLCGHCKGVVLWDRRCVGWLVHSLPRWPCHDRSAPSGCAALSLVQPQQTDRGQSFLWLLLPAQALAEVLLQVQHMQVGGWEGVVCGAVYVRRCLTPAILAQLIKCSATSAQPLLPQP